jgi:hypothetical protein
MMPSAGGQLPATHLPVVDDILAAALTAQGAAGVRALGLLRDAHRVLAGTGLERPAEVAESCLRGAADALLSLPGAPDVVGLRSAAKDLLAAVDAFPDPSAAVPPDAAVDRVRETAEVLRGQLASPGGFHRARAAGIAERLMGVALGRYHEQALAGWGEVYARTSGTLHGGEADPAGAAAVYREVLLLARELLVPLPGRAARVLELAALDEPGAGEVREPAGWADPRAIAFFGSAPAAACWAGTLPLPERDGNWVLVAEELLKDAVDLGHAGYRAYREERRRAHAERRPLPEPAEVLEREWAARLPEHDITGLLRELVVTVHAPAGGPFRCDRAVRGALAGLLRRDIETSDRRPWPKFVDLDEVRVLDATLFLSPALDMAPLLARAVLDLAAADAAAGLPLAARLRAWPRIAAADTGVHDRVLAAHLAAHPPPAGADEEGAGEWWDLAGEATVRLLAGHPTPEGARLTTLVLDTCPPGRAAGLHQRVRTALGPAPTAAVVDRLLPAPPAQG